MEIYTLLIEVGRSADDGLPDKAVGAGFLVFAPGRDEEDAVREAVNIFQSAQLNPYEVSSLGTMGARTEEGYEFSEEEIALAEEAIKENAVVILDKQVFYDDDDQPPTIH